MKILNANSKKDSKIIDNTIIKRSSLIISERIEQKVKQILSDVATQGDKALLKYTALFDKVNLKANELKVNKSEILSAYKQVGERFMTSLLIAKKNIKKFHEKQLQKNWTIKLQSGIQLEQRLYPLQSVGVYIPGGKAGYPSTVLMCCIPAKLAGVPRIVLVSPPQADGKINPYTLVAAQICKVDEIYKVGGAHAIAALAYGTESIPKVDKIVGPGNIYVTAAKKLASGTSVDIDMLAGPTEILIIADKTANPNYIAADLLAQAEHDEFAFSVLITNSKEIANSVIKACEKQLAKLSLTNREIAEKSLSNHGYIILVENLDTQGVELANKIAPEHLLVTTAQPKRIANKITTAGAIFIGSYTPVALGDYIAGPNHVLPTGGTSRFKSPLNVDDFVRKTHLIKYTQTAFQQVASSVIPLAKAEGFLAHANSISIRLGGH